MKMRILLLLGMATIGAYNPALDQSEITNQAIDSSGNFKENAPDQFVIFNPDLTYERNY